MERLVRLFTRTNLLETPGILGNSNLRRQALHTRCAEEANDSMRVLQHVSRIFRFCDWSTVTEHNYIWIDFFSSILHRLHSLRCFIKRDGCMCPNRSFRGKSHVRNKDICTCFCQGTCLIRIEGVGRGEQIEFVGNTSLLDFQLETNACLFQVWPEHASKQPNSGKILHAGESHFLDLFEKIGHYPEGISAAYPRQHRRMFDDGKHLAGH